MNEDASTATICRIAGGYNPAALPDVRSRTDTFENSFVDAERALKSSVKKTKKDAKKDAKNAANEAFHDDEAKEKNDPVAFVRNSVTIWFDSWEQPYLEPGQNGPQQNKLKHWKKGSLPLAHYASKAPHPSCIQC